MATLEEITAPLRLVETNKPTIGRIVHYRLTDQDTGAFAETGNVRSGMALPAIIVRVWSDTCVNLRVIGDAPSDAWLTSRCLATQEQIDAEVSGVWFWPTRD